MTHSFLHSQCARWRNREKMHNKFHFTLAHLRIVSQAIHIHSLVLHFFLLLLLSFTLAGVASFAATRIFLVFVWVCACVRVSVQWELEINPPLHTYIFLQSFNCACLCVCSFLSLSLSQSIVPTLSSALQRKNTPFHFISFCWAWRISISHCIRYWLVSTIIPFEIKCKWNHRSLRIQLTNKITILCRTMIAREHAIVSAESARKQK